MDEKLLSKVCFNMVSMAGFIKVSMPMAYEFLFDLEDEFTKDELETILDLAEKNISANDIEDIKKLIDELASKYKEENNG